MPELCNSLSALIISVAQPENEKDNGAMGLGAGLADPNLELA